MILLSALNDLMPFAFCGALAIAGVGAIITGVVSVFGCGPLAEGVCDNG